MVVTTDTFEGRMEKNDWLTTHFEATRNHLQGVAYRILGSRNEAEDAV
jgi:DNA-directed RNA polymerase specialized sigma24 family protein